MKLSEMAEKSREINALFEQTAPRPWTIEALITELTAEVGTLADSVMIKENYRRPRDTTELDLEDDIVDIIFLLFCIADHYHINIEDGYTKMLELTRAKLLKRMNKE